MFDWRELDVTDGGADWNLRPRHPGVLGQSVIAGRFDALRPGHTHLVGREEKLHLLVRRWELAERGVGRAGAAYRRSRDRQVPAGACPAAAVVWVSYASRILDCSPHHKDKSPFSSISAELLRAAGIEPGDDAKTKLDKLEALLQPSSESLAKDMPLFAALLSIPVGESSLPVGQMPQQLKASIPAALLVASSDFPSRGRC